MPGGFGNALQSELVLNTSVFQLLAEIDFTFRMKLFPLILMMTISSPAAPAGSEKHTGKAGKLREAGTGDSSGRRNGAAGNFSDAQIADAIKKAEGLTGGIFRYGIRRARDERHARLLCLQTIANARARWVRYGSNGDFIQFLGQRYCPPACDPVGHANWMRNVSLRLAKSTATQPKGNAMK